MSRYARVSMLAHWWGGLSGISELLLYRRKLGQQVSFPTITA